MHPPFMFTDHKVDPDFHTPKQRVKRTRPARLDLSPAPGWPPVPLVVPTALPSSPTGVPFAPGFRLQVVPPPRATWRDWFGRFLIRVGQRMILQNRPG
ncbi:hypothetical protein AB3Y40_14155 [Yoonia sp. R2331]|uniref:hypothetical protein n=1 Tax=Yoonia sp. R2331 TaxID=3237238 RepID=UPI0034E41D5C